MKNIVKSTFELALKDENEILARECIEQIGRDKIKRQGDESVSYTRNEIFFPELAKSFMQQANEMFGDPLEDGEIFEEISFFKKQKINELKIILERGTHRDFNTVINHVKEKIIQDFQDFITEKSKCSKRVAGLKENLQGSIIIELNELLRKFD